MRWRDALHPVVMQRIALLAPREALRALLVAVAELGTVELDEQSDPATAPARSPAAESLQRLPHAAVAGALAPVGPDLDGWARDGRVDLLVGEAQLEHWAGQATLRGRVAGLVGWVPSGDRARLAGRAARVGAAVVVLPRPAGTDPPTLLAEGTVEQEFGPLVDTYATVPYADLNPALIAGLAYIVMFGMMFADVGHGAVLLVAGVVIRLGVWRRLERLRRFWLFIAGAGVASMLFGALYGELFGPTHVIPVLWLAPLDHPVTLLVAAVGAGALMLSIAYGLGTLNRFREGGWQRALYAPSGLAGVGLFLGLGLLAGGIGLHRAWLAVAGGPVAAAGLVIAYVGLVAAAGGHGAGFAQAAVELFDLVLRLASNLVSFARLAAFGLTHAALGQVIWQATSSTARSHPLGLLIAAVVFVVGNAVALVLEGLVVGIQALRLEYYELFSRIFDPQGRPFRPWHLPISTV